MKEVLLALQCILIVALVAATLYSIINKNRYSMPSAHLNICGIFAIGFYSCTLLIQDQRIATLIYGLYFASLDWVLLLLFIFVSMVSETISKKQLAVKIMFLILMGVCTVDTIFMILNMNNHFVFALEKILSQGNFYCWNVISSPLYHVHLFFCYILCALISVELIYKATNCSKNARKKYIYILLTFIAVLIINFLYMFTNSPLDISVPLYGLISLSTFYFCYLAVPRETKTATLKVATDKINCAIMCFDIEGHCIYQNNNAEKIFSDADSIYASPEDYLENGLLKNEFTDRNKDHYSWKNEYFTIDGTPHIFYGEYNKTYDRRHRFNGSYIRLEDNTVVIKKIEDARYRASHDALTGLYNRKAFFERAAKIIKAEPDVPKYLIATNIENFKLVNELFGAEKGDELLRTQAKMLSITNAKNSLTGRINADRFALLINKDEFNPELAVINTARIQVDSNLSHFRLHTTLGVYEVANPYESVSSMYDKASLAAESIYGSYDVPLAYYDVQLMEELKREKTISNEFQKALEGGQFKMYLQPQVSPSGEILGAEALVRWHHPDKGILPPPAFLDVLEKKGFVSQLDAYIWEEAAKKLADWKQKGIPLHISINISARDFYYSNLYDIFTKLVEKYDIEPQKLKLEITETLLMHDTKMHQAILDKLQQYGFEIEMDDFGAGYSSLNTLTKIKMDVLKIDMGFLSKSENEEKSRSIVCSIIKMAKALGMKVISEGVETQDQAKFLADSGCDIFQGYYFSKPISINEFENKFMA